MSQEMREKILGSMASSPAADFIVLEESWPALEIFLRCQSQWRYTMSGITGMDYTAVISVIELSCRKKRRRESLFRDVCLIEQGALKTFSKKRERNG